MVDSPLGENGKLIAKSSLSDSEAIMEKTEPVSESGGVPAVESGNENLKEKMLEIAEEDVMLASETEFQRGKELAEADSQRMAYLFLIGHPAKLDACAEKLVSDIMHELEEKKKSDAPPSG